MSVENQHHIPVPIFLASICLDSLEYSLDSLANDFSYSTTDDEADEIKRRIEEQQQALLDLHNLVYPAN